MKKNLSSDTNLKKGKRKVLFAQKFATLLLVQSKLLPASALGIKDLKENQ